MSLDGLARFAFQARPFNHSDISPFRVNDLRAACIRLSHAVGAVPCLLDIPLESSGLTRWAPQRPCGGKMCQISEAREINLREWG